MPERPTQRVTGAAFGSPQLFSVLRCTVQYQTLRSVSDNDVFVVCTTLTGSDQKRTPVLGGSRYGTQKSGRLVEE